MGWLKIFEYRGKNPQGGGGGGVVFNQFAIYAVVSRVFWDPFYDAEDYLPGSVQAGKYPCMVGKSIKR